MKYFKNFLLLSVFFKIIYSQFESFLSDENILGLRSDTGDKALCDDIWGDAHSRVACKEMYGNNFFNMWKGG